MIVPSLTRRRMIGAGVLTVGLVALLWTIAYFAGRDPERAAAVATYERMRPGMSSAEFLELVTDQPIRDYHRDELSGKTSYFSGSERICYWTVERFMWYTEFDSQLRLKKAELVEAGWMENPTWCWHAKRYLGLSFGAQRRHWP